MGQVSRSTIFSEKVVAIQNANTGFERSLSDNKNMVISERTNLSDETIMQLRRLKLHLKGIHNINILSRDVINGVQLAHNSCTQRKEAE